jgi:hypothetical protein
VADDERHLLGGAQRRRDDQIALAFAIVIVGDDDELAIGKRLQNFLTGRPFSNRFCAGMDCQSPPPRQLISRRQHVASAGGLKS